jgi:hypothetical protein
MPTVEIETNLTDATVKARVARAVGLWLRRQGVPLSHSIVKYRAVSPEDVFSGPYRFDRLPGGSSRSSFALVTCRVADSRPETFRAELATVISRELASAVDPELLFVDFDLVDPGLHYAATELVTTEKEVDPCTTRPRSRSA